ncbi:MAG: ribosome recycling factor [Aeriscardovia sp.]|nr:ribosome recycling factor [Aeriscardovia sp.]MBQ1425210.1 ribosome recycling factor [Aeriscardovia sp.]MBQ5493135.1 ribosome recycling factor [Aeriscardovia sp.]MBQ5556810.1 ribosome recycling factor [Aeriscardovia sp.]
MDDSLTEPKALMGKSLDSLKEAFQSIRTGRANPALVEGIVVNYYGAPTPLRNLATITAPDTRSLAISPFDVSQISAVEKALRDSDLGVNPSRDGNTIRVALPALTEERRKEYVKLAKQKAEGAKIAVRNIRRKAREEVEAETKSGEITEDEQDQIFSELDKLTKKFTDEIDSMAEVKEKEILTV